MKPLEDVKKVIEGTVRGTQQKAAALNAAKAFRGRIQSADRFDAVAAQDNLRVQETGFFTALGYIPQIGRDPAFSAAAFKLQPGGLSDAVEGARGAYVMAAVERQPADMRSFASQKSSYIQQLLQRKQNQFYQAWFKDLMKKANIKDYREMFY